MDEDRRAATTSPPPPTGQASAASCTWEGWAPGSDLSAHLASRQKVGGILAESGAQVLEFRASIVIGSGSLSFEISARSSIDCR